MLPRPNRLAACLLLAAASGLPVPSMSAPAPRPVKLHYGLNKIDLTGQGDPAVAVLSLRENFNAHSFTVLTMYLTPPPGARADAPWHVVPLFTERKGQQEKEDLTLTTSGGADCELHGYRLLAAPGKPMRIIVADREFGDSFADTGPVRFDFYELKNNDEQAPGWPLWYFEFKKSVQARHKHCDVGEAFKTELGY